MDDENKNEEVTQDDFLKAFGITEPKDNDKAQPETSVPETKPEDPTEDNTNPGAETQPTEESKPSETEQTQDANNTKAANAFAAMRVELANKNKLLEGVMSVLNVDPKSKDSAEQLQTRLTEALAKKQGIPTEILQKMNNLEEAVEQRKSEDLRNAAYIGFQQVKDKFKLDDKAIQDFAQQLYAEGKNPFLTRMNLMDEYKLKNFDKLLEQAVQQGTQKEIERAAKATNNASTPDTTQGRQSDPGEAKPITTVKQLNDWFNKQQ